MNRAGSKRREPTLKKTPLQTWSYLPHVFALLAIAAALAHFRTQIDSNDEGIATMGAWRILTGQVPYRDFFAIETPLSFYLVAPLYKLLGPSFEAGRIVTQLLGIALVVSVFRLARRWIPSPLFAAVPLAFLCQAGVGLLPFANHHWFADVFCLASLTTAERALSDERAHWWPFAGAAAALAFESLQDQGILILIGLGLIAALAPPREQRAKSVGLFLAGAFVAGLPLALIVLPRSGFAPAWHDLVVFPLTAYRQSPGNAYGFFQPFGEIFAQWSSGAWRHAPVYIFATTITSLSLIVSPIAAVPLVLWTWRRRGGSKAAAVLLLVGVIDFVLTACHRWAPINLQWAAAPPALALGWWLHHEHEASPKGRRATTLAAIVLLAAFGVFGIGRIGQAMEPRIWFDVVSPAGVTRIPSRGAGQLVQEMIATVGQRVPAQESLLVYAWPTWAFATLHPCPVRWDGFAPPDFPPGKYTHGAIAEVEDKKVAWIVTPAFDPPPPGQVDEWKDYIGSHYQVVWANAGWGLWKRNGG
jgi:4-amino-4-deoxy-L-arabinose transferase-like glycosyltransferase